ncbi:MAG: phosphoglycerate dehydrogenase [Actinobacteria bacterium]|nr:phosphoglycerate dehydrogenase [Actinomycetota bacterium]
MGDTSSYKVLVAEKISPEGIEKLKERFEVDAYKKMSHEDLLECVGRYDALIVRSGTSVDSEVIDKAENLKIIGRAGIGVDNIDVEAATRKGVMVANVPESNIISAAEHTMAMLMAVARNIPAANISLSGGEWNRSAYQGVELYGKTLGIIGLGRIGALVAERALGFGMKLAGYDPFISVQKAKHIGVELKGSIEEVIQVADFITLHVPRNEDTYHLIGKDQMVMAKDSVRIVNVSRGGVVDEEALAEAIETGEVAGAAIDVFECEPPGDSRLCKMPGVVVTPHLGASTTEAQYKAGVAIAEQVIAALDGQFVGGAVNIAMPHKEVVEALQPYLPLCEKLGKLITHLVRGVISEMEFETLGSISEFDTSLLTVAFLKGLLENVSTESVTYVNAPIMAMERGITLKESKSRQSRDYLDLITVSAHDDRGKVTAGATMVGKDQEMFVNVFDFSIDIAPSKYLVFVEYEDRPGMIGKIGGILGENSINIVSLQVGRRQIDGNAAMGMTLDRPITPDIKDRIKAEAGIVEVTFIFL